MKLPANPTVLPMLAKRVSSLPVGDEWIFEPKWDGFRALFFKDGDEVFIQSRDEKPLVRYFPELIEPLRKQLPDKCVLDGEIVIAMNGALEFDALQLRLHPAESRVKKLSAEIPASIVFFDLLALGDDDLRREPFAKRRAALERLLRKAKAPLHITPATRDRDVAADWFTRFEGAGLDGVMAKGTQICYEPNKRVMLKVKHEREADCVVAGFRWHKDMKGKAVGSLLLGLFDEQKTLHHVGVCASFTAEKRRELVEFLEPYTKNALDKHPWKEWAEIDADVSAQRKPGQGNRWNVGKDMSWVAVRPELVAQVAYDHMQGDRFRHTAQFRRWRADRKASSCTYEQLEVVAPYELGEIFG